MLLISDQVNVQPLLVQTGTCEALRPWALTHTAALTAQVVSLTSDTGALQAQIRIVNKDISHPAFWVRLALEASEESLEKGQCNE